MTDEQQELLNSYQKELEKHRNLEVVDSYSYENRTCSVIRYTTPSTNWVYFLDCKEVKK
jgi:hypothetical protein